VTKKGMSSSTVKPPSQHNVEVIVPVCYLFAGIVILKLGRRGSENFKEKRQDREARLIGH